MMTVSPKEYTLYAKAIVGVLAIVNPLGAIPFFLSLSGDRSTAQCRQVARTSAFAVAVILIVAIWAGDAVLGFFGIGIPVFRLRKRIKITPAVPLAGYFYVLCHGWYCAATSGHMTAGVYSGWDYFTSGLRR